LLTLHLPTKTSCELMGSTREKLIGFNTAHLGSPKIKEAIKKALAGKPAVFEDAYASVAGGRTTFLRAMFNPVTPGHSPSEVIATLEDVTERRLAEKVIMRRILSLTQPIEDASEFASRIFSTWRTSSASRMSLPGLPGSLRSSPAQTAPRSPSQVTLPDSARILSVKQPRAWLTAVHPTPSSGGSQSVGLSSSPV
jgi:hypothetical protein